MNINMQDVVRTEVLSIKPVDVLERQTIDDVLSWVDSGVELCRIAKPATPNKHLVSYFVVVDGDYLLLVDHINAEKWLPTGGHVEPNEHPKETAIRECNEELGFEAELLNEHPIFITQTETVGKTAGHTDVSLWYLVKGDRHAPISFDELEFNDARWFRKDELPSNTDPHLSRFVQKLSMS